MSKQIICDKCGRVIDDQEIYSHVEVAPRGIIVPLPLRRYDICGACLGDVRKALGEKDEGAPGKAR